MMHSLKNSVFSKVLQVLLVGYFLISSLNLSNTIKTVTSSPDGTHKKECVAWGIFKKMFKCSNTSEEIEDGNDAQGFGNSGKVKLTVDYLIPGHSGYILSYVPKVSGEKVFITEAIFSSILYNKIHLPPPERFI